jgi:tetratricopeptide (TPR) repeat protein
VSTSYFFKARDERDEARRQETRANEQSDRANAEAEHANEQRQLADRREVVTRRALDFMVEVFKSEDPLAAPGDVPTTREVLDRATRGVEEEIGDEPELQGVLAGAIALIYVNIGDNARARSLYEKALDAFRRIEKDDPKRLPTKGLMLALDGLAQGLEVDGEFERAGTLRHELLERARRGEGGDDALAGALLGFATHHSIRKQLDEAEEFYRAVLAEKDGRFASSTYALVKARQGLAEVMSMRGRIDEAIGLLREAAAEAERSPKYRSELTLGIQLGLAGALYDARRFDEAVAVYEHVADTYLPRLDPDKAQALTIRLYYGGTLLLAGRKEEAIDMLGDCLARARRTFGETHRNYLVFLQKYVEACTRAGRLKGLEPQARELVEIHKRMSGGDYELGGHLITLANVIAAQGEPRRAIPPYLEALDAVRRSVGIETVPGAHTLIFTLRAYVAAEAYEEALPLARESLAVQGKVLGKQSVNYMLAAHHLGIVLLRTGDPGAAEPLLRESRELLKTHGPTSPEMAATLEGLAEALAAEGRTDEAIEAAKEHVAFAEKRYAKEDRRLAAARKRLEELEQPPR